MEDPIKIVLFLLPPSAGDRLRIDGYTDALEEVGIIPDISREFEVDHQEIIDLYTTILMRKGYDLIIYPSFDSQIFRWEPVWKSSFFCRNEGDVDIKTFIKLLEDKGCRLLAESMHIDGPFDDEVTIYGTPANFAQYIREKLDSAV